MCPVFSFRMGDADACWSRTAAAFLLSPVGIDGLLGEAGAVGGVIMQSSEVEEEALLLYTVGFGVGHQPEGLPFGSRVGRG